MPPETAGSAGQDRVTDSAAQRRFVGEAEVREAMRHSPSNPCFAGGTVLGGTFAAPDGVVIVIERPDGKVLRINGTVLDD